jgi:hypothetical protein
MYSGYDLNTVCINAFSPHPTQLSKLRVVSLERAKLISWSLGEPAPTLNIKVKTYNLQNKIKLDWVASKHNKNRNPRQKNQGLQVQI